MLTNYVPQRVGARVEPNAVLVVFVHHVSGNEHVAGREDALVGVVMRLVAQIGGQQVMAYDRPRGTGIDDVDAASLTQLPWGAAAIHFARFHDRSADAAKRKTRLAVVESPRLPQRNQPAIDKQPVPAVVERRDRRQRRI